MKKIKISVLVTCLVLGSFPVCLAQVSSSKPLAQKEKNIAKELPSLVFAAISFTLNPENKQMLGMISKILKDNPEKILMMKIHSASNRKSAQQLCDNRGNTIKHYLIEIKGISSDRIVFQCDTASTEDSKVDFSLE